MARKTAISNKNVNFNEGIYFIPYDTVTIYQNQDGHLMPAETCPKTDDWTIDPDASQARFETVRKRILDSVQKKIPTMSSCDFYEKSRHVMLENSIYKIAFEDNGWSFAVEMLLKKAKPGSRIPTSMTPTAVRLLRDALLGVFPVIYSREESWNVVPVTLKDMAEDDRMAACLENYYRQNSYYFDKQEDTDTSSETA